MDEITYEIETKLEATHWWFVGRRRLLGRVIRAQKLPRDAKVLDVGCGSGANLRLLRELGFAQTQALDFNPVAIAFCEAKGLGPVEQGDMTALPFPDASFDLVLATDVIEHVDRDDLALSEIRRVLRPGGHAIVTVPAFPSLWGIQDKVGQHKRRYLKKGLLSVIRGAGLHVREIYHFNFILFAPVWMIRRTMHLLKWEVASENNINMPGLNWMLTQLFSSDTWMARWLKPPFGVSLFALLEKR